MSQSNKINRAIGVAALAMMFGAGSVSAQSSSTSGSSGTQESGASNTSNTPASGSTSTSSSKSSVSRGDRSLMDDLAKANLSEIETAKMAQSKTQNDQVKQFAQKMIDDHTQAQQQLEQLAQQKGVQLPTEPDLKHKAEMKMLSALDGAKFDKAYMSRGGLSDHRNAHQLLAKIESKAKDPDLKALAAKLQPVIDQHLAMARDISGKSTASGSSHSGSSAAGSGSKSVHSPSTGTGSGSGTSTDSGTSGSSSSGSTGK